MKRKTYLKILLFTFPYLLFTNCGKEGCTDPIAHNFDPSATKDDGKCFYGLTESTASFTISPTSNPNVVVFKADNPDVECSWDFGNGNNSSITNPDYNITINNNFIEVFLTDISDEGCENTSSLILTLNETYDLYVPNTFTPDSDEHNQTWGPVFLEGFDKFNFQLLVFNRWGEIVWESKDADARWDGTYSKSPYMCPDGIYTWKILYKQKDTDEKITRTGHVTIMR